MNDNLDKTLEAWKEQRTPKDAQFESEEKFAADFFEKAAQLPSKKMQKSHSGRSSANWRHVWWLCFAFPLYC